MMAYDINPDTFCKFTPDHYVPRNFTKDELILMGSKSSKDPNPAQSVRDPKPSENPKPYIDPNLAEVIVIGHEVIVNEEVVDEDVTGDVDGGGKETELVVETIPEPDQVLTQLPKPTFHESGNANTETVDSQGNTPVRNPLVIYGTPSKRSPPRTYFGLVPGSLEKKYPKIGGSN